MRTQWTSFLVAVLTGAPGLMDAADLSGKVKLSGTPPPEASMKMTDPVCGRVRGNEMISSRHYMVGADNGLGNVLVYLSEGAAPKAPGAEAALLDQVNCEYAPYVLGMQAGQKLKIRNSDPTLHNVNAQPKVNKPFNVGQPVKGMVTEKTFEKPEVFVRFKCDVHPWMFAFVGVVDHPYYAVTDKDGAYKISGVPAGKYKLTAVHPKAGTNTVDVTVGEGDAKPVDFTLSVPAPK